MLEKCYEHSVAAAVVPGRGVAGDAAASSRDNMSGTFINCAYAGSTKA